MGITSGQDVCPPDTLRERTTKTLGGDVVGASRSLLLVSIPSWSVGYEREGC